MARLFKSVTACISLFCLVVSTLSSPSHVRNREAGGEEIQSLASASSGRQRHTRSAAVDDGQQPTEHLTDFRETLPHRRAQFPVSEVSSNKFQVLRVKRRVNDDFSPVYYKKERKIHDQDININALAKASRIKRSSDENDDHENTNFRIKRSFRIIHDKEAEYLTDNERITKDNDHNVRIKRSYDRERDAGKTREQLLPQAMEDDGESDAGRLKRSLHNALGKNLIVEYEEDTHVNSNSGTSTRIKRSGHNHMDPFSHLQSLYKNFRVKRSADYDSYVLSLPQTKVENFESEKKKRSASHTTGTGNILPMQIVSSETLERLKRSLAPDQKTGDFEAASGKRRHSSRAGTAGATGSWQPRAVRELPTTLKDSEQHRSKSALANSDRVRRSVVAASRILREQQRQQQQHQMAGDASQQVSSYTAYELSPAATKHKGSKGTSHKHSGHKAGFVASSGHKSGSGHKAGKGFEETHKGAHEKKGASGHSGSGGKKYSGGEHKSHHHGHATSGKKGSKGHARGHKAHHSKGAHSDGFKAKKNKKESGGKKSFYDESDHKGYHSQYDHFDSFHESSSGGSEEKSSHSSLEKHDAHGKKGEHESGKQHKQTEDHAAKHGHKDTHKHKATSQKTASHEEKHASKH